MTIKTSGKSGDTQRAGSSTGPTVADIKDRFSAGSIPLDTDFADLIGMADCGRKAIGQSPDQTDNSTGAGLQLAGDGKLSVKGGSGITIDGNGVSVNTSVFLTKGMIMMFSGATTPTGWALCDGT